MDKRAAILNLYRVLSEEGRWPENPSKALPDLEAAEALAHRLFPEAKPLLEAALAGDRGAETALDEGHPLHAHILVARRLLEAAWQKEGEERLLALHLAQVTLLTGLEEALTGGKDGGEAHSPSVHRA